MELLLCCWLQRKGMSPCFNCCSIMEPTSTTLVKFVLIFFLLKFSGVEFFPLEILLCFFQMGNTALIKAVINNRFDNAKFLLKAGADVNFKNEVKC